MYVSHACVEERAAPTLVKYATDAQVRGDRAESAPRGGGDRCRRGAPQAPTTEFALKQTASRHKKNLRHAATILERIQTGGTVTKEANPPLSASDTFFHEYSATFQAILVSSSRAVLRVRG